MEGAAKSIQKLRRGDIPSMAATVLCRSAVVVVLVHGAWLLHRIKEISEGFRERRKKGRGDLTAPELEAAKTLATERGQA